MLTNVMLDETIEMCVKHMQRKILRIMVDEPYKTIQEVANDYSVSYLILIDLLRIGITPEITVELHNIPFACLYAISKLPLEKQNEYLPQAKTMAVSSFVSMIKSLVCIQYG